MSRLAEDPIGPAINYDEFSKIDLRVARVVEAAKVEGADKLLRLRLDVGGEERTVFAGIKSAYDPATLQGRLVVVVANLAAEEDALRGVRRHGARGQRRRGARSSCSSPTRGPSRACGCAEAYARRVGRSGGFGVGAQLACALFAERRADRGAPRRPWPRRCARNRNRQRSDSKDRASPRCAVSPRTATATI